MASFRLQIISQTRVLLEQDVMSIIVPGQQGYFGVLANHAPMMAALGKGKLTIKTSPLEETTFEIEGGFLEVRDNKAVLLPDRVSGMEEATEE